MRFGVKLGVDVPSDPNELRQLVTAVDEFGYDSIWVGDHVVIPRTIDGRAHESQVGGGVGFADKQHSDVLDPIVALTFIASLAPRLRIGLSVLVIPYRDPVVCAKMLATLDVLSGGRLIVGAGVGWMKEEFDALGVPFETRGELTDQYLATMIELWSSETPAFDDQLSRLDGVSFLPKPQQSPYMPIWIGGNGGPAMRRAAQFGQGWMPNFQTPDELGQKLDRLHAIAEANGRRLADLTIAVGCRVAPGSIGGSDLPAIAGTKAEMCDEVGRFAQVGVDELVVLSPRSQSLFERLAPLEQFATEVIDDTHKEVIQ